MKSKRKSGRHDVRNLPLEKRPNQEIRKALKAKGLTQRDFARAANMSDTSMSYYMNHEEMADNVKQYILYMIAGMPEKKKKNRSKSEE